MKLSAIIIFIYGILCYGKVSANDDVVRILEKTQSSQLVRLNMGSGELKPADAGLLVALINQRTANTKLRRRYLPVAKAFLVKSAPRNSIWVLQSIAQGHQVQKIKKLLKVGASYLLLLKRDFLRGRKKREVSKLQVISESARSLDDEDILFENGQKQLRSMTLKLKKWMKDETHQEISLSKWVKQSKDDPWMNEKKRYWSPSSIVKSDPDQGLAKISELNLYEKSLSTYLKKLNDPGSSWKDRIIAKDDYMVSSHGFSADRESSFKVKAKERELLVNQRRVKGLDWSSQYSEEELRSWVEDNGSIEEIGVRRKIDNYSLIAGFHVSLGFNLANNELASDFQNRRKFKISFEGSAELFPFRRLENYLRHFSIEFGARIALDALATGAANALSQETSLSARFLWYRLGPQRMEKNIFFLGPVARLGFSSLEVSRTSETGRYNLVGVGLVGGYRYNFKNGFGARALLSFEQLALQSSSRSEPVVHLENQLSISDFRMQVGLSYVF